MADYRDIGKVMDDLFGGGSDTSAPELKIPDGKEAPDQENTAGRFSEKEEEDASLSGLMDRIKNIREMVEKDFRSIDESVRKSLESTGSGTPGPDDEMPSWLKQDDQPSAAGSDRERTPAGISPQKTAESSAAKEPEKTAMEELDELIGLDSIKRDVKELVNLVKTRQLRQEQGMKSVPVSLHLVFSGNPGTGKTTVARILARIYKEIGVLSGGQLVETDRSGLVAGFVGQTAIRTQEKLQEAMGGVLFIDEAYTLAKEGQDYGQEAIDTILKAMEDNRDNLVVIVAGYTDLMKKFIGSNPGLKSRFNKYMEFPDYTADELMSIFEMQCKKYEYQLTEASRKAVADRIRVMEAVKGENFANARDVRNLFENIVTAHASRVAAMEAPTAEDLRVLLPEDLLNAEDREKAGKAASGGTSAGSQTVMPPDAAEKDPAQDRSDPVDAGIRKEEENDGNC